MINFKVLPKRNPTKPELPAKFYAQIVYNSKVDMRTLSKRIARATTLSNADVITALTALEEEIAAIINDGSYVELGNLCLFYPTLKSSGAETSEEFTASKHITKKGINVRVKKVLLDSVANATVKRVQ